MSEVTKTKKQKKSRRFGIGLSIYCLIFMLLGGAALYVFWQYLDSYEQSRVQLEVDRFMESADEEYWKQLVIANADMFLTGDFESSEAVAERWFESISGNVFSIRRRSGRHGEGNRRQEESGDEEAEHSNDSDSRGNSQERDANEEIYIVRAGSLDFARVTLRTKEDVGFGMASWEVTSVELCPEIVPETHSLSVTIPGDVKLIVNGVSVSNEYRRELHVHECVSDLEQSFVNVTIPYVATYQIDGLYYEPEVITVNEGVQEMTPVQEDAWAYVYEKTYETHTVTITAPREANVMLCGAGVPRSTITSEKQVVSWNQVNEYIPGAIFPAEYTYVIPGILTTEISVEAVNDQGTVQQANLGEDGVWHFGWTIDTIPAERETAVRKYVDEYVVYASNLGHMENAHWAVFREYLVPESDAYERMLQYLDALEWTYCEALDLHSTTIDNYYSFGDDAFMVRVTIDYSVTKESGTSDAKPTMDLLFLKTGSGYKVCLMRIL